MTTTMSKLPDDMAEEILSRVPLTSLSAVRSTCKKWAALSKKMVIGKSAAATRKQKQFMGYMVMDYRVCSMKFNLQKEGDGDGDDHNMAIKQVSILDQIEISKVYHCNGLLLCVTKDNSRLLLWNPYLGQTRWIQPRNSFHSLDMYGLGYDKKKRTHKILRIFGECGSDKRYVVSGYEVYDLSSNLWKVTVDKSDWKINRFRCGVSLNGTSYFFADNGRSFVRMNINENIISFDFTTERFGKRLPLPFKSHCGFERFVSLSCVRQKKLAVLHQSWAFGHVLEIWVTDKIDPFAVSWSKFWRFTSGPCSCRLDGMAGSFFVNKEKKFAVVVDLDDDQERIVTRCNQMAYVIGQDGYFKSVGDDRNIGKIDKFGYMMPKFCRSLVCSSSYVPSTVQLNL